jgi:phosphopantothenoylcysteine decarboxylase/phosphopantothenate--cysteine ligase
VHPVENIRGSLSSHLEGRTVVLAVAGSIAAVKSVELARELIRHGAQVVPVMSEAATRILHPDALEFATGRKPIVRLSGQVEHVQLLGDVPGKADLLLVAPATANTVSKMALGIDDTPITTCATVAFGTKTPVVVAPAMHEAMLDHPIVTAHQQTLVDKLGVTWVEPLREEKKAKLADVEAIVEAVIHRLANAPGKGRGPLAGRKVLVVAGASQEPVDPIRVLTNRSSGATGVHLATALHRLGAEVALWMGHATVAVPEWLEPCARRFSTVQDLLDLAKASDLSGYGQVWMPAALGDFQVTPAKQKLPSEKATTLKLEPMPKAIAALRKKAPKATLVAFKAESDAKALLARAKDRLKRYKAQAVVANTADAFGAASSTLHLVTARGAKTFKGDKARTLDEVARAVAALGTTGTKR